MWSPVEGKNVVTDNITYMIHISNQKTPPNEHPHIMIYLASLY